jgi:hypothetical protein
VASEGRTAGSTFCVLRREPQQAGSVDDNDLQCLESERAAGVIDARITYLKAAERPTAGIIG